MRLTCLIPIVLCACASTRSPSKEHPIQLLFIQSGHGYSLTQSRLVLRNAGKTTIYFSDRPNRVVGHTPTTHVLDLWGQGDDSFAADPPNASLSTFEGSKARDFVVELSNPRLQGEDLHYDVKVLSGKVPASGGACTLFIDQWGREDWAGTRGGRGSPVHAYSAARMPVPSTSPWGHPPR
jgi:hypothetical protein